MSCLSVPTFSLATVKNLTGFETGDTLELNLSAGTMSIQSTTKRTGGYALQTNPTTTNTGSVTLNAQDNGTNTTYGAGVMYYRFYFRYGTKPSAGMEPIFRVDAAGSALKAQLNINSGGFIVVVDSASVAISTGTTALSANTWYRLEFTCGAGATPQAYELKIDGTSELSGTAFMGSGNHSASLFGKTTNFNGNTVDFYYDDFLADTASFPGAGQIETMIADSTGTYTTWSIGAGSGAQWEQVDEVPTDSNTTYLLSTNTDGNIVSFGLESTTSAGISGTIKAVKVVNIVARNTTNGSLESHLRSGGTDSASGAGSTIAGYQVRTGLVLETDPSDSSAWTTADLDAVEIGAVENSGTVKSRLSTSFLSVDFAPSVGGSTAPPMVRRVMVVQ